MRIILTMLPHAGTERLSFLSATLHIQRRWMFGRLAACLLSLFEAMLFGLVDQMSINFISFEERWETFCQSEFKKFRSYFFANGNLGETFKS